MINHPLMLSTLVRIRSEQLLTEAVRGRRVRATRDPRKVFQKRLKPIELPEEVPNVRCAV